MSAAVKTGLGRGDSALRWKQRPVAVDGHLVRLSAGVKGLNPFLLIPANQAVSAAIQATIAKTESIAIVLRFSQFLARGYPTMLDCLNTFALTHQGQDVLIIKRMSRGLCFVQCFLQAANFTRIDRVACNLTDSLAVLQPIGNVKAEHL